MISKLFILCILLHPLLILSQQVSEVYAIQNASHIQIKYILETETSEEISVSVSTDGGKVFTVLRQVQGDVGTGITSGSKEIIWHVLDEFPNLIGEDIVFQVNIVDAIWPEGYQDCGVSTEIKEVRNPITNRIWMDRNLGASRAATFAMDSYAYGDLYQWGRFADGHQCRNSQVSQTLSSRERTQDAKFIVTTTSPWDWRTSFNSKLWLGLSAVNNPCPIGFRLPSNAEWLAEIATWKSRNAAGAYASILKLQLAGNRYYSHARLLDVGSIGNYWSSSVDYPSANYLYLNSNSAQILKSYLGYGFSIRCMKE